MTATPERRNALRFIVCLGIVSLLADMTYEGARSITGPFLSELGATATQVGLIAGFGEMMGASLRYFSGRIADRTRAYWTFALLGYGVNIVVVPALAFAGNWQVAALLVIAERTGKSLRGPSRDVLLSEATGRVGHGWGFGLHAAMDQIGAVLGPLFVAGAVARGHAFAPAFLPLAIPATLAVVALLAARAFEPARGTPPPPAASQELPRLFWIYTIAAGALACGFVDFALLAFHLQRARLLEPALIPLLYAGAMAVNGATALLFGRLFDRFGIRALVAGIAISSLALPLGFLARHDAIIVLAVMCWATGMGAQDATLRAGIAQVVSMNKRGTAFGSFNAVYGVMWFAGSAMMGLLYDRSMVALVLVGAGLQVVAAVLFYRLRGPLDRARAAAA